MTPYYLLISCRSFQKLAASIFTRCPTILNMEAAHSPKMSVTTNWHGTTSQKTQSSGFMLVCNTTFYCLLFTVCNPAIIPSKLSDF